MQATQRRRAVFVAAVLAVAGCDCGQKVQKVNPAIADLPDGLDYGLVAVGDSFSQTVEIKAETSADVSLKAHLEPIGDAPVPFTFDSPPPDTIPGNGSVELSISFKPPAVDTYAATLVVETDDANHTQVTVTLSGSGKSPQISVTPDHIALTAIACPHGASSPRCTDSASFTIQNAGEVKLDLGTVDIEAVDDAHPLPPVSALGIAPLISTTSLDPSGQVVSKVVWKPTPQLVPGPGGLDFQAKLVVPSNDPAHPKTEIPITAHADPNGPPTACVSVVSVTRKEYVVDNSQTPPVITTKDVTVPASEYTCASAADQCTPGEIQVRPGMKVNLTSAGVDGNGNPCTADPEGDTLSYAWSISAKPDESRAHPTPTAQPTTQVEIDAVGKYTVNLVVHDSLNLAGNANIVLNAIPRDDVAVQLSWQDAPGADLDLHLLTDQGPNITVPARMFCLQDCFFFNPSPDVFGSPDANASWSKGAFERIPHLLRDDQGSAGQLESASLVTAPPGSRFRVAVHVYDQGTVSQGISPKIAIRLKGAEFGPFTPTTPLTGTDDVWVGAQIDFPTTGAPTATALQVHLAKTSDPNPDASHYTAFTSGVGSCD